MAIGGSYRAPLRSQGLVSTALVLVILATAEGYVVCSYNWESAMLATALFMNLTTRIDSAINDATLMSETFSTSAGCIEKLIAGEADLVLESWLTSISSCSHCTTAIQSGTLELVPGGMGYNGFLGLYLPTKLCNVENGRTGKTLEYYGAYDAFWNTDVHSLFSTLSTLQANTSLIPTQPVGANSWETAGKRYLAATNDTAAFDENGSLILEDDWWKSPKCRADSSTCIPVINSAGWTAGELMQLPYFYNMSIMIASVSWTEYVDVLKILNDLPSLLVYWQPDRMAAATRVIFPPHNKLEYANYVYQTAPSDTELLKYRKAGFASTNPKANHLLESLAISQTDVQSMFDMMTYSGYTATQAAEHWLDNNYNRWKDWVNYTITCHAGFGISVVGVCSACGTDEWSPGGAVSCQSCPANSERNASSFFLLTQSVDDCHCIKGNYKDTNGDCIGCPEGLACNLNNVFTQEAGYWASNTSVAYGSYPSMYKCLPDANCPAGPVGSCADHRTGVACGRCEDDYYGARAGGDCSACGDGSNALIWVLGALLVVAIIPAFLMMKQESYESSSWLLGCAMCSALVSLFQVMACFNSMAIAWEEPFDSLFDFASIFAFDLDFVQGGCAVGGYKARYLLQLMLLPFFVVVLLLAYLLGRLLFSLGLFKAHLKDVVSTKLIDWVFLFLEVFLIAFSVAAFSCFNCYESPNGKWLLTNDSSIVCWGSSDHDEIMVIGMLMVLLYPVTTLVAIGHCTVAYPRKKTDPFFYRATRSTFDRFVPERYYGMLAYSVKMVAIGLVPSITDQGAYQVVLMSIILVAGITLTLEWKPWRVKIMNFVSWLLDAGMLIVLISFSLMSEQIVLSDHAFMQYAVFGAFLAATALPAHKVVEALVARIIRGPKAWDMFLTHHKASDGITARWIKQRLVEEHSDIRVFLDSDNLRNLDELLTAVSETAEHVVLLSNETMRRPWCACEIVIAHKAEVPMRIVQMSPLLDVSAAVEAVLSNYELAFGEAARDLLATQGIAREDVEIAYRSLIDAPCTMFATDSPFAVSLHFPELELGLSRNHASRDYNPQIYMIGDHQSHEVFCAAELLVSLLSREIQMDISNSISDPGRRYQGEQVVVVMLSDALYEEPLCKALTSAAKQNPTWVPIKTSIPFDFSSTAKSKHAETFNDILKMIAFEMSTMSNEATLGPQVHLIDNQLQEARLQCREMQPLSPPEPSDDSRASTTLCCTTARKSYTPG